MKDNFNVYEWRIDQIRKENISEQLDDEKAVQSIASAVSEFADIKNDKFLQGVIRTALGSGYIKERVVEDLNEDEGTLNKIADILGDKFDNLRFDVNEPADRIDVRGSQQDLFNFGDKLHGSKIYGYEVFHVDDDDRGEIVRIIKSDRINEGDGLWANIRAKKARGEKPARKGSKAYKIAKKAGDKINND